MKAFVSGAAAAIVIAVLAALVLNYWGDWSRASVYQSGQGSVRL